MKALYTLFIVLAMLTVGCASAPLAPVVTTADAVPAAVVADQQTEIQWHLLEDSTVFKALEEKKNIIVYVRTGTCPHCTEMEEVVFKDQMVVDILSAGYIMVFVDIDAFPEQGALFYGAGEGMIVPKMVFIQPDKDPKKWVTAEFVGATDAIGLLQLSIAAEEFFITKAIDEADTAQ